MTRLRIGILAPEFTDQHGGMQELAREVITRLARTDDCVVYTRAGSDAPQTEAAVVPLLTADLGAARRTLARGRGHNVWFALNAGCAALAPYLDAPTVTYIHGNDVLSPWFGIEPRIVPVLSKLRGGLWRLAGEIRERAFRRGAHRGLRASARLLSNSENTASIVRQTVGDSIAPIGVVYPGVSDDFFGEVPERRTNGPLELLTVSRLVTSTVRKNVEGVIRAVALLPEEIVARYLIIGSGDDCTRLEELARSLALGDRVRFLGSLDRDAIIAAYGSADLFVMASKATEHDVEGFGIVYLEASATGLPVLCSRAGGATEAVHEGENGLIIDGAEPDDIAAGVRTFHARRAEFNASRVRAVAERFRWDAIVDRLRNELLQAAQPRPRATADSA